MNSLRESLDANFSRIKHPIVTSKSVKSNRWSGENPHNHARYSLVLAFPSFISAITPFRRLCAPSAHHKVRSWDFVEQKSVKPRYCTTTTKGFTPSHPHPLPDPLLLRSRVPSASQRRIRRGAQWWHGDTGAEAVGSGVGLELGTRAGWQRTWERWWWSWRRRQYSRNKRKTPRRERALKRKTADKKQK